MNALACLASLLVLCGAEKAKPAPRTWWDADYPYRREVKISGTEAGYAAIEFRTMGRSLPDRADVRLIAEDKNLVGFVRLDTGRDDTVLIACPIKNPRLTYRVYFGNSRAKPLASAYFRQGSLSGEAVRVLPKAGLLMELRALGEGEVDTLEQMRELVGRSQEVLGRELRHSCALARNPFDERADYLVLWRGALTVPAPGAWQFATNSNGPSFVVIDGKEVAAWPGWHNAAGGELATHAGEVRLKAGLHTFEYLYAARGGAEGQVCGIKGPGDEEVRPLGEKDFAAFLPVKVGTLEDALSPNVEDFNWHVLGGWGYYGDVVLVRFTDLSTLAGAEPASRTWKFGDGQTAEGKTVEHLYLECGVHDVELELADAAGKGWMVRARVAVDPRDRQPLDGAKLATASLGYDCVRLADVALRNLVLLRWEDPEARGFFEAAKVFFRRKPALSSEALVRCAEALLDEVFFKDHAETAALGEYLLAAAPGIELRTKAAAAAADTLWHLQGKRGEAERLLRHALGARVGGGAAVGPLARLTLAELLDAKGVKNEAAEFLGAVGGGAVTEYMRGELTFRIGNHIEKKDYGRAWEALAEWITRDPNLVCGEASFWRAKLLAAAAANSAALAELERFLPRATGTLRKDTLTSAAAVAAALGMADKAAAFAKQLAEEYPANSGDSRSGQGG